MTERIPKNLSSNKASYFFFWSLYCYEISNVILMFSNYLTREMGGIIYYMAFLLDCSMKL